MARDSINQSKTAELDDTRDAIQSETTVKFEIWVSSGPFRCVGLLGMQLQHHIPGKHLGVGQHLRFTLSGMARVIFTSIQPIIPPLYISLSCRENSEQNINVVVSVKRRLVVDENGENEKAASAIRFNRPNDCGDGRTRTYQ